TRRPSAESTTPSRPTMPSSAPISAGVRATARSRACSCPSPGCPRRLRCGLDARGATRRARLSLAGAMLSTPDTAVAHRRLVKRHDAAGGRPRGGRSAWTAGPRWGHILSTARHAAPAARGECGMGASPKYAVIDPATGAVDRRIFSDQAIYDDEMEKIFGRVWLMIGHESLVPHPHDFFHTYMGEDPVILTRDGQGRLHALLNMCRHRGNRVVRCDDGSARSFMCTYHGWTYASDGALTHVPGESEAYYGALDKPAMGLLQARIDTYAGIVFATWADDAPTL